MKNINDLKEYINNQLYKLDNLDPRNYVFLEDLWNVSAKQEAYKDVLENISKIEENQFKHLGQCNEVSYHYPSPKQCFICGENHANIPCPNWKIFA